MDMKNKLGRYHSGFRFSVTYPELEQKVLPSLDKSGRKLYEALLKKAMREETPTVTLSVADVDGELSAPTLRKCREELAGRNLVAVTRESSHTPYRYELLNPFSGGKLLLADQRTVVTAALKPEHPPACTQAKKP